MEHGNYDEFWKARNLLPHLKDIKPAVMTVGGWFDAEDLYGAAEHLSAIEATSPERRTCWSWGRGPRRLGAATATRSGHCRSRPRPPRSIREKIEFPFFEHHLKDRRSGWEAARGLGLRDRPQRMASARRLAPETAPAEVALSRAERQARLRAPDRDGGRAFDEYVSDPAHPVPYTTTIVDRHARAPSWSRTSDSPPGGPMCSSTRPSRWTEDVTVAGPIRAELQRLDYRHRLRLGGQADRRLSRRLPRPRTRTRRASGWAAISSSCGAM